MDKTKKPLFVVESGVPDDMVRAFANLKTGDRLRIFLPVQQEVESSCRRLIITPDAEAELPTTFAALLGTYGANISADDIVYLLTTRNLT